jgi:hypothetical protein
MIYLAFILLLIGGVINAIAYARLMRRQAEIQQVSAEYASQLFRSSIFSALFHKGYVRTSILLFVTPPGALTELMSPMRTLMAVAILISLSGLGLFLLLA